MKYTLEISGIRLLFGERLILSDVYLYIENGNVLGLLGRNGEGKSCVMRAVYGTLKCEKSVRFNDVLEREAYTKPHLIRYLPQHAFIPKHLSLKHVFSSFGLDFSEFTHRFPEFEGREKSKLRHLSGGMVRVTELYCIVKSSAQFILLDEPFTHLNPLQIEKVKKLIKEEAHYKGFLLTDHLYKHILHLADDSFLIKNGKLHTVKEREDLVDLGYIL